jgi:hypothetical protein
MLRWIKASNKALSSLEYVCMAGAVMGVLLFSGFVPQVMTICENFFNNAVTAMR